MRQGNSPQNFKQEQQRIMIDDSSNPRSSNGVTLREKMMTNDNSSSINSGNIDAYQDVRLELRNMGHNLVSVCLNILYDYLINSLCNYLQFQFIDICSDESKRVCTGFIAR